jgi:hypothetical protein
MKLDNTEGSMIQQSYRQQQTTADSEEVVDIGILLLVPAHHIKSKDTNAAQIERESKIESKGGPKRKASGQALQPLTATRQMMIVG